MRDLLLLLVLVSSSCLLTLVNSGASSAEIDPISLQTEWEDENESGIELVTTTTTSRALQTSDPIWWNRYRSQYGKRVKRCKDLSGIPVNGTDCKKKRAGEYSCFWEDQRCSSDQRLHPRVKCNCLKEGGWNCVEPYEACGDADNKPFTECPAEHPLNFPFKPTCDSTFMVCNYGFQTCCGEIFPTSTCECIDGEFKCFSHETCKYRTCSETCPSKEPKKDELCSQASPLETCAYGLKKCCGKEFMTSVHQCFNGKWDQVTDLLINCDCNKPATPSPTTAPKSSPTTAPKSSPTTAPTSPAPTSSPTSPAPTTAPTSAPTSPAPTTSPTSPAPTTAPTSPAPTSSPTSPAPTTKIITPRGRSPAGTGVISPATSINTTMFADDFKQPVYLTHGGDSRIFVVERSGRIILIQPDGTRQIYLDIQDRVISDKSEQGLLSIAFLGSPGNGQRLFASYISASQASTVSEFSTSLTEADKNSEVIRIAIDQPLTNHNGGQIQFGPDGYLYLAIGDGGGGGDPFGSGQNTTSLLSTMVRLDVSSSSVMKIPSDNPFVGKETKGDPHIWAYGLRNPWRFSFDRLTGDLYIGDVGQRRREEVNFQAAGSAGGQNYGWNAWEGTMCFRSPQCQQVTHIPPVLEYDHSDGCSITGGYVYRGKESPALTGFYLYGDFCRGTIWGTKKQAAGTVWETQVMKQSGFSISSFGEDVNGELYVLDYPKGAIHKINA